MPFFKSNIDHLDILWLSAASILIFSCFTPLPVVGPIGRLFSEIKLLEQGECNVRFYFTGFFQQSLTIKSNTNNLWTLLPVFFRIRTNVFNKKYLNAFFFIILPKSKPIQNRFQVFKHVFSTIFCRFIWTVLVLISFIITIILWKLRRKNYREWGFNEFRSFHQLRSFLFSFNPNFVILIVLFFPEIAIEVTSH